MINDYLSVYLCSNAHACTFIINTRIMSIHYSLNKDNCGVILCRSLRSLDLFQRINAC